VREAHPRDDDKLVRVPEELRETANGRAAELKIVSIPDDVQWVITKTDGHEQVREVHRTWEGRGDDGQRETGSGGRARLRLGETTDAHLYLPISVLGSIERHRHG
jgi:hypothetical protein